MNKLSIVALGLGICLSGGSVYAQSSGFFSNEIQVLAGSNDTISILTGKYGSISNEVTFAVSYIPNIDSAYIANDKNWKTITFQKNQYASDLAYGGGVSVVPFDTAGGLHENKVIAIDHKTNTTKAFTYPWTNSLRADTLKQLFALNVAYCKGSFYFAANDGGLVRWQNVSDVKSILLPGTSGAVAADTSFKGISDETKRVIGVEVSKDVVIVTTPSSTWKYTPADSSWTEYPKTSADADLTVTEFECSFADGNSAGLPLYSIAKVKLGSADTTVCIKYSKKDNGWKLLLNSEISGVSFAVQGYFYTFYNHDSTNCKVYRDTLGDSAVENLSSRQIESYYLPDRLVRGTDIPEINDIQFIPQSDSSGILWVATSNGLYLSRNEKPGTSSDSLLCIKKVSTVKKGLKEAFACPGILKYDPYSDQESFIWFVYNLSKDAKVTIRIYDFNMDCVKTVIEKESRKSGDNNSENGRSNNKIKDVWDGTTSTGRRCAPGVYYFKITTDIGEHAFGKIVVAK